MKYPLHALPQQYEGGKGCDKVSGKVCGKVQSHQFRDFASEGVALGHQQPNIKRKLFFLRMGQTFKSVIFNDITCKSPIPLNSSNFPELLELQYNQDQKLKANCPCGGGDGKHGWRINYRISTPINRARR